MTGTGPGEQLDSASVTAEVGPGDTAERLGSGDLAVLGTPRVVALVEAAAVAVAGRRLAPNETSVGTRIDLQHLAPTPVGETVKAEAVLVRADGRGLYFDVSVTCGGAVVARGRHERVVVDRLRFLARVGAATPPAA